MAPQAHAFLLFFAATSVAAYDIVEILKPFPDYTMFTQYLTQTKVADEINSRNTITVLVVPNYAMSPFNSLSPAALKNAISIHVLLDYYDLYKLDKLPNKTSLLPTLFQTSGLATNNLGFVNYTELPGENMAFGSAAPGEQLNSHLQKVVAARPYNISVLEISSAIVPQGITRVAAAPPKAAASGEAPKTSPATPAAAPKAGGKAPAAEAAAPDQDDATAASPEEKHAPAASSAGRAVVSAAIGLAMGAAALFAF